MVAVLIQLLEEWIGGAETLPIVDEASVSVARERVRSEARAAGFGTEATEEAALVASELGHNQLRHAARGWLGVVPIARRGTAGIEILAVDGGPGIGDLAAALEGGASTRGGLGQGLAAARRLSDELDLDTRRGLGTAIRARKYAAPVPRGREVGIVSRPAEGESEIGDHARFVRRGERLVLALADGLGHGEPAFVAASRALRALLEGGPAEAGAGAQPDPERDFERAQEAVRGTRGAVAATAWLDQTSGALEYALVGNIRGDVIRAAGPVHRLQHGSGYLGQVGAGRRAGRLRRESAYLDPGDALLLASDGLLSAAELLPGDLLRHPAAAAHTLLERFARKNDDATVVVVR
jgi:anti-sigma regulatory factor (Ser/Thr protein kinase)